VTSLTAQPPNPRTTNPVPITRSTSFMEPIVPGPEPIVLGPSVPDLDPTLGGPNRPHLPAPLNPHGGSRDSLVGPANLSRVRLLSHDALSARPGDVFNCDLVSHLLPRDAAVTPPRSGASCSGPFPHGSGDVAEGVSAWVATRSCGLLSVEPCKARSHAKVCRSPESAKPASTPSPLGS
jgi:hypothetical protein